MEFGLMRNEGLVMVTGDPGTGKSTVINDLLADYEDDDLLVARIIASQLEVDDLLRMLAYAFSINAEGLDKASVISQIEDFLHTQFETGRRVLLIIDEAQHLSEHALEELRLLTNIQHNHQTPLQIFLLGQPQLKALVKSPGMEQLRQRIIASCEFELLDVDETRDYIKHRLKIAGWKGDPEITNDAFQLIHRFSGGVPRQINMLCSRLLLYGSVDKKHRLTSDDLGQVIEELPAEMLDDLRPQGSAAGSTDDANDAENQTPTEQDSLQRASRSDMGTISPLPKATPVDRTSTTAICAELPTSTRPVARDHSGATPKFEASMSSVEPHPRTHWDAPITDTVKQAHSMTAEAEHSDSGHERVATGSTETLPLGTPQGVDRRDPLKPHIPRGKAQPHVRLRKKRMRRLSLTAVIVFAGVFASSYAYLTWSPDEIAGLIPKLHALIAEHIRLPGNGDRDAGLSDSTYAGGDQETNTVESPSRADAQENSQRTRVNEQWAKSGLFDKHEVAASDPGEQVVPRSRVDVPMQSERIDMGNSRADVAVLENKPINPQEVPINAPATQPEGSAPSDLETQQARLRDPSEPSEEQAVARARREQPQAADSGVVERGGKRVISGDLERALRAHSLDTQRMPDGSVKITLHGVLPAEADRVRLDTEASQSLDKLAFVLRNYEGFIVQIIAHRDADPTDDRHVEQLRRRAQIVAKYLIVHGVPIHRVYSDARGEHRPAIAMSNTGQRSTRNREIEIFLRPTA